MNLNIDWGTDGGAEMMYVAVATFQKVTRLPPHHVGCRQALLYQDSSVTASSEGQRRGAR